MNIIDARGMTLSGADQEIISAEVTYGGAAPAKALLCGPSTPLWKGGPWSGI